MQIGKKKGVVKKNFFLNKMCDYEKENKKNIKNCDFNEMER